MTFAALAMNFFKAYGYVTTSQALALTQDLKLAHYTHIAPWVTLSAQSIATLGKRPRTPYFYACVTEGART